jgi:D-alanyl-lipoteichoic acid acyltransferase DltB (MBOAT superfamily)
MSFTSLPYILFLAMVLAGYWLLSHRWQNIFLLAASWVFYGYINPWLLALLAGMTVTCYLCSLGMAGGRARRKWLLALALTVCLGTLGLFKYLDFFLGNIAGLLAVLGLPTFQASLHLILPAGISFYTFLCAGYSLDVYHGRLVPERNFVSFALLAAFFPTLQAGPIERGGHLLPQINHPRRLNPKGLQAGLQLLIWGFFQKLVVADNLATVSNKIFALKDPDFWLLWTGVLAFTFQILADFSGYTDIARGSARLLGFELLPNFNRPYLASSPADFWRRWHMSLSYWLRDYVYIPLGGSRRTEPRASLNVLATFLISGLWHGAGWNFVLWGLYHGLLVLLERWWRQLAPRMLREASWLQPFKVLGTFGLVAVGWLMFRETDLGWLLSYFRLAPTQGPDLVASYLFWTVLVYSLPLWVHMAYAALKARAEAGASGLAQVLALLKPPLAALLLLGILTLANPEASDFIYSKF